ncbi:hypothetical protein BH09SUM1_BH09SUM1_18630 [soil metagenome]
MRRSGRTQLLALAAAAEAIAGAALTQLERDETAVLAGSGAGESNDTVEFLRNMIANDEAAPKPSKFINSVPSSVAGQIALEFGLRGETAVFMQHSASFEAALWQGLQTLRNGRVPFALVCGADAIERDVLAVGYARAWWRKDAANFDVAEDSKQVIGSIPGEGAAAFLLAPSGSHGRPVMGRVTVSLPQHFPGIDPEREAAAIAAFLKSAGVSPRELAFVLTGANGNGVLGHSYRRVMEAAGLPVPARTYKQTCGEFCAAASLGLFTAMRELPGPGVALIYHLNGFRARTLMLVRK